MDYEYEFGEVFDCINVPNVEHFIIILGVKRGKGGKNVILYTKIVSRVYKAFRKLSKFFDGYCRQANKCKDFFSQFKENENDPIFHYANLGDTLFLDKETNFFLTDDSMVVINSEPRAEEVSVFEAWRSNKMAKSKGFISNIDVYKLMAILDHSENVSDPSRDTIRGYFNRRDKMLKKQADEKRQKLLQRKKGK